MAANPDSTGDQCFQMAKCDPFLSLDCARVEGVGRNPREGRDQILQRSVVEPFSLKPEGPNIYNLKVWLMPSGNHAGDVAEAEEDEEAMAVDVREVVATAADSTDEQAKVSEDTVKTVNRVTGYRVNLEIG